MRHSRNYIGPTRLAVVGATVAVGALACDRATPSPGSATPPPPAAVTTSAVTPDTTPERPRAAMPVPGRPAIARGTNLAIVMVAPACSDSSRVGDSVSAVVTGAVMGSGGAVIPAGASVIGSVRAIGRSLGLAFDTVVVGMTRIPIDVRIVGQPSVRRRRSALSDVLDVTVATARDTGSSHAWSEISTTPASDAFCVTRGARLILQLTADAPVASGH
jgi:hypothetical protein